MNGLRWPGWSTDLSVISKSVWHRLKVSSKQPEEHEDWAEKNNSVINDDRKSSNVIAAKGGSTKH